MVFTTKDIDKGRLRSEAGHPLPQIDWLSVYLTRKYGTKHLQVVRGDVDCVTKLSMATVDFDKGTFHEDSNA